MKTQLLTNPEIFPSRDVLKDALGRAFGVFEEMEAQLLTDNGRDAVATIFAWHYYRDSKAWLCKVSYKKKTVFWLSVWEGFFKTSFFFLERHLEGIAALGLKKDYFKIENEWGKMIPLIMDIDKKTQLTDLRKVVEFKKECK